MVLKLDLLVQIENGTAFVAVPLIVSTSMVGNYDRYIRHIDFPT